jgi:glucose-6-phosphate isomerase
LRSHPVYKKASQDRVIKFLANIDPIDFDRAVQGLNVEETLILVNSKTFTTAETILNAKSCRKWLLEGYEALGNKDA